MWCRCYPGLLVTVALPFCPGTASAHSINALPSQVREVDNEKQNHSKNWLKIKMILSLVSVFANCSFFILWNAILPVTICVIQFSVLEPRRFLLHVYYAFNFARNGISFLFAGDITILSRFRHQPPGFTVAKLSQNRTPLNTLAIEWTVKLSAGERCVPCYK